VEKEAQKCGLLLQFKKLPKVNYYPLGENSPNLVTLDSPKERTRKGICSGIDQK
jgi:hypothetical protein